ncbi:MAG TPA: 4'-phosphopantetheinyl transferase superfamily protein [Micromonosporaceae bacterium]|jgi:4'-phosphopantetheinyl transferase
MVEGARCEVWWADVGLVRPWHLDLLDDVEQARRERLRRAADRDRFVIGAVLLRLVMAERTVWSAAEVPVDRTCTMCGKPHGRPTIAGSGLHVSVSHSGAWVAVAVTRGAEVGVDVEEISDIDIGSLESTVLSAAETVEVATLADFFRSWSRKEALVKAAGDGLSVPLNEVVVDDAAVGPRLVAYPGRPRLAAQLFDLERRDGYAAALAVLTAAPVEVVERSALSLLRG